MSLSLLQANCSWREHGRGRKALPALCLFSIMQCRAVMAEPVANTGKAWKNKPTSWSGLLPQVHCVHFSFNQVELWLVVQAPDFHRKSARVTRKRPGATKAKVTAIARQEMIEIVWMALVIISIISGLDHWAQQCASQELGMLHPTWAKWMLWTRHSEEATAVKRIKTGWSWLSGLIWMKHN